MICSINELNQFYGRKQVLKDMDFFERACDIKRTEKHKIRLKTIDKQTSDIYTLNIHFYVKILFRRKKS